MRLRRRSLLSAENSAVFQLCPSLTSLLTLCHHQPVKSGAPGLQVLVFNLCSPPLPPPGVENISDLVSLQIFKPLQSMEKDTGRLSPQAQCAGWRKPWRELVPILAQVPAAEIDLPELPFKS